MIYFLLKTYFVVWVSIFKNFLFIFGFTYYDEFNSKDNNQSHVLKEFIVI